MVGILISTIPSMYLFIFTGFWYPAGKTPVLTARELSETIGTSERNTDRERIIRLTIFYIWFLLASSWHGHTHRYKHTSSNIRQEKAREEEEGVKLERNTGRKIPIDPLCFIQVFLFSQVSLTGIIPLQRSIEENLNDSSTALIPTALSVFKSHFAILLPKILFVYFCMREFISFQHQGRQ